MSQTGDKAVPKKLTLETFIEKAKAIYGGTYDYSKTEFKNRNDIITIICPVHGEFPQRASIHLDEKHGCPKCGMENRTHPHKKTTKQFIEEARSIHGDYYDYSLVDYKTSHTKVKIVCPVHGVFSLHPYAHTNDQKQGCRQCGYVKRKMPLKKTTEQFVKEAKAKWGERYDYSNTVYTNKQTKLKYICSKHGEQQQLPTLHLLHGCQYCSGRGISKHTNESFIKRAKEIHGDLIDYSQVDLTKIHDKVTLICPKHSEFKIAAYQHFNNAYPCPMCASEQSTSLAEEGVRKFISEHYEGSILSNDRKALKGRETDIYLPNICLGIEFHGMYFHREQILGRKHHLSKADIAKKQGIKLIQIYESEWENSQDIVKSRLLNLLGINQKIPARKAKIVYLDSSAKNAFLIKNHLQGTDTANIALGLKHHDDIVAVMTFGKPRFSPKYEYELIRYASLLNTNVVGGAGKLFSHFVMVYKPSSIVSYADRRWSDGGLYEKLGFKLDGTTSPGYLYYNLSTKELHHRIKFQKHKLKTNKFYDEKLSEYEIMLLNGYDRIWDAGHYRYIKTI